MANRIEMTHPAMRNALRCLVELLTKTPNINGIIAKMITSAIVPISKANVSVSSIALKIYMLFGTQFSFDRILYATDCVCVGALGGDLVSPEITVFRFCNHRTDSTK